jgi:hypothetical protein
MQILQCERSCLARTHAQTHVQEKNIVQPAPNFSMRVILNVLSKYLNFTTLSGDLLTIFIL